MSTLAPDARPAPLDPWEPTSRDLAIEDRRWDRWEDDYDTDDERKASP
ncbi:hypothetical protein OS965_02435 [Streptomyces sp. H27-G5]|nr:hypothetical protein [Streptomyces sp. H27-G5]MCY0917034.1 hypothetical protein [Streptomyces sp. H27-G5]